MVFDATTRLNRSGPPARTPRPMGPPQSCTTSVMRPRSRAATRRAVQSMWFWKVYASRSVGLSDRPKPIRSGAMTQWPAAASRSMTFR